MQIYGEKKNTIIHDQRTKQMTEIAAGMKWGNSAVMK